MNAAAPRADAFGFTEDARCINEVDLIGTANRVGFALQRSAALLRMLHHRLLNDAEREVSIHDVEALVELALQALPDPNGEAFDAIEQFEQDAKRKVRTLLQRQQAMTAVLDAMEVAARPDATLDKITEAAKTAHDNACLLPDGARHWEAFCTLIEVRGMLIEWVELGSGFPPQCEVHTPESLKKARKVRRKMTAFVQAVHGQAEQRASRQPMGAARKRH